MVQQIIARHLTVKEVARLCEGRETGDEESDDNAIPQHTRQLVRLLRSPRSSSPDNLARLLLEQEQDVHLARARLRSFRELLDEAEKYLA